jgi:hypothetical protein
MVSEEQIQAALTVLESAGIKISHGTVRKARQRRMPRVTRVHIKQFKKWLEKSFITGSRFTVKWGGKNGTGGLSFMGLEEVGHITANMTKYRKKYPGDPSKNGADVVHTEGTKAINLRG